MQLTTSLWMGAAAGDAGFSFFGNPDQPIEDRLATGAILGAGVGAVAGTAGGRRVAWLAGEGGLATAKFGAKQYWGRASSTYAGLRRSEVGALSGAFHAYGTRSAFTAVGAVIGAASAGEGHRTRGAAIGAAAGFGVRSAVAGVEMYSNMARVGGKKGIRVLSAQVPNMKMFGAMRGKRIPTPIPGAPVFIGGLAAIAFGAGLAMRQDDDVMQAAYNPAGGYDEYPDGAAPDTGIRERLRAIGADGDVALGAHRMRHG